MTVLAIILMLVVYAVLSWKQDYVSASHGDIQLIPLYGDGKTIIELPDGTQTQLAYMKWRYDVFQRDWIYEGVEDGLKRKDDVKHT